MIQRLTFFVPGEPRPKGSWRPIVTDAGAVAFRNSSAGVKPWQYAIGTVARGEMNRKRVQGLVAGAVDVNMTFLLAPTQREPDLDKLVRAVLDGLKGTLYDDDKRVRRIEAEKTHCAKAAGAGVWLVCAFDDATCVSQIENRQDVSRRRAAHRR